MKKLAKRYVTARVSLNKTKESWQNINRSAEIGNLHWKCTCHCINTWLKTLCSNDSFNITFCWALFFQVRLCRQFLVLLTNKTENPWQLYRNKRFFRIRQKNFQHANMRRINSRTAKEKVRDGKNIITIQELLLSLTVTKCWL